MRLRIAYHLDPSRPFRGDPAARYAELLAQVEAIEAAGLDTLWVAERPTEPGALLPAAIPFCAAALTRTERLHLGTGVLPLPLHHPLRVAEDAATLDRLSAGRFELGVGIGADPDAAPAFGVPAEERAARFDEAVALLRNAWREQPLAGTGPTWSVDGTDVHPKPATPGGPPLYVAALAPAAQRRAGAAGVGLFLAPGAEADAFLEAHREAGHVETARLARLLAPHELRIETLVLLVERFAAAGVGRLDLVAPAPAEAAELKRWPELAAALRDA